MNIKNLSTQYFVRCLTANDIDEIYALSCENDIFYKHHPPFVSQQSIEEDMLALPQGKTYDDKFYVGFFQNDRLIALMDLILDFPAKGIAFIGLFMMKKEYQGKGVGSFIIGECISCLRNEGFTSIQLGTDRDNPQSNSFWMKNHFHEISERNDYIIRELRI